MQVRAMRLMNANPRHSMRFTEHSFIEPVKGQSRAQTWKRIERTQKKAQVTLVMVGSTTHQSKSVAREVAFAKKNNQGVAAMKLPGHEQAKTPKFLRDANVRPVPWNPNRVNGELARAAREASTRKAASSAQPGTGGCA